MNTSAKLALAAAVVGVAVVGIFLLRASGEMGQRSPPVVGPAGNGLVAYSSDGDIFVGDPLTGTSTAIVSGPSNDTVPVFSPDGLRIAFVRSESERATSIVVVRADGSDERVVMAEGFIPRSSMVLPGFAWTPDSTSLVLNHDSPTLGTEYFDGELSLFDASGVAERRLITPPLPAKIGWTYFGMSDSAAPMFRPPNGDQILSYQGDVLSVVDIDGTQIEGFVPPSLTEFEPYSFGGPAWSRDGSMISFELSSGGLFVMNADGSDLRRFETDFVVEGRAWSPDGSKIALQKSVTVSGRGVCDADILGHSCRSVIAILDVETGAERVLDVTFAVIRDKADRATDPDAFRTLSPRTYHRWAYEGWSWTPDGRSIVVLERHGTRPMVVDIETGLATELPWTSESVVSWQRIAVDRTSRCASLRGSSSPGDASSGS